MEIDQFFISKRSLILELTHVANGEQVTDCFIKGLNLLDLANLCDKMNLVEFPHPS
jgi:hypothetical protein